MLNVLLDDASDVILDPALCRALFKVSTPLAPNGQEPRLSSALDEKFHEYYAVTSDCRRTADALLDELEAAVAAGPSLHELASGAAMQRRDSGGRTDGLGGLWSSHDERALATVTQWLADRRADVGGGDPEAVLAAAQLVRAQREDSQMRAPESMFVSLQINDGAVDGVFRTAQALAALSEPEAREYVQAQPAADGRRRVAAALADALRFLPTLDFVDDDPELAAAVPPFLRLIGLVLADNMNMREFHQTHLELLFLQQPQAFAERWAGHLAAAEEVLVLRQFMGQIGNGLGTGATELEQSDRGNLMFYLGAAGETAAEAVVTVNTLFDKKAALAGMLAGLAGGEDAAGAATVRESIAAVDAQLGARLPHAQRVCWRLWAAGKRRLNELEARLPEGLRSSPPAQYHRDVGFDADYIAVYQYVVFKGDLAAGC